MPTTQEMIDQASQNTHWVDFGAFKLLVNLADGSGQRYKENPRRDELTDPLMIDLIAQLRPQLYLDLGANFGFTALLHHHLNPTAAIVAVEMSPLLVPFLRKNFETVGIGRGTVVNAACGAKPGAVKTRLNTFGSADNRVVPATAEKFLASDVIEIPVVSVDQLLADAPSEVPVFIKIDTQGYEEHVFNGASQSLARLKHWAIKSEFGPDWLRTQGTDAKAFLRRLVESYDVAEMPTRPRFRETIDSVMAQTLSVDQVDAFVDWLASLAPNGRGWTDLLILPKRA
jgi:FkbM family methyltransferase